MDKDDIGMGGGGDISDFLS